LDQVTPRIAGMLAAEAPRPKGEGTHHSPCSQVKPGVSQRLDPLPERQRPDIDEPGLAGRTPKDWNEELLAAYKEFQVAQAELCRQNEELRVARRELEAERQRYLELFDSAPDGYLVTDGSGLVQAANRQAAALLAVPQQSLPGKSLAAYVDHDDRDALQGLLTRLVEGEPGTPQRAELRFQPRHSPPFEAAITAATVAGSDGQPGGAGLRWLIRDVSERKRTHAMLQQYAQRLQFLREVDKDILAARSAEEIAEKALPRARQVLPCRFASVVIFDFEAGKTRLLGVHAEGETALGQGQELPLEGTWPIEQLARGESYVASDACTLANESLLAQQFCEQGIDSFACVPLLAEGRLLGALNLGLEGRTPMTPGQLEVAGQLADALAVGIQQARLHQEVRHRAQDLEISMARRTAALQASEARFRIIFEDSATGIALLDFEGRIIASNPALQRMLGFSARELLAKTFDELTHPEDVATGHTLYEELLAGKRDYYNLEKRYIRRDGSILWVRPTVSLVRRTRGGPQYAIKTVEDISEQKKAQEALVQAEKLTIAGQLGASMAHEINNPLQAVIGCLGLAEESLSEGGDAGLYLRIAREELRRAARIVAQLRDLHRRSSPEEQEPVDLNELLEQVLLLVRKQMETLRIEVTWARVDELPHVMAVPDRIRQVFLNILLNAADAMPRGGNLGIDVRQTLGPDGLRVAFADSGAGIAPEEMENIFEPFHSTKPEGLGLGMFIMRRIVTEHKGDIQIESEPGRGTTVAVWLPLHPGNSIQEPNPGTGLQGQEEV
jgi:PAS domain S-box-containing protein